MNKHDTATGITAASARCMSVEIDAKRQCIAEIEALQPETPAEYKLKDESLAKLRDSTARLETQLGIMRLIGGIFENAAQREGGDK